MTFKMSDYVSAPVGAPTACFDIKNMKALFFEGSDGDKKIFNDFMTVKEGDLTFIEPNSSLDADPALRDTYFGSESKSIVTIKFVWKNPEGISLKMSQSGKTVTRVQISV